MKCHLKHNQKVEIEHNGKQYLCGKNCPNQSFACFQCDDDEECSGCEIYNFTYCRYCEFYY